MADGWFLAQEGMPHMKRARWLLGLLGLLTLTAWCSAQDIVSVSVPATPVDTAAPAPASAAPPVAPTTTLGACSTCEGLLCDPHCNLYWLYVHHGVKNSFEMYARVGPSFVSSGGDLDDVLHTGVAADFGVRSFCYNHDHSAAWYGELGGDYIFNNGDGLTPVIESFPIITVTRTRTIFGQVTQEQFVVPTKDFRSITELHRVYAKIGGGYQMYFGEEGPGCMKWYVDLDAGIRLGHAHAATHLIRREFTDGFKFDNDRDVADNNEQRAFTDFIKNFYIGGGIGMLIPYCGFDVAAELHWEYSHDIINLPAINNRDQGLDQVKVQAAAGLRW